MEGQEKQSIGQKAKTAINKTKAMVEKAKKAKRTIKAIKLLSLVGMPLILFIVLAVIIILIIGVSTSDVSASEGIALSDEAVSELSTLGFTPRYTPPDYMNESDYSFYWSTGSRYKGQCTWYAVKRANEILKKTGSTKKITSWPNADQFCNSGSYIRKAGLTCSYPSDGAVPKVGAIVVWNNDAIGHVGVIEAISKENNKIYYYVSEANTSCNKKTTTYNVYGNGTGNSIKFMNYWNYICASGSTNGGNCSAIAKCWSINKYTLAQLKVHGTNEYSGYSILAYIYTIDYNSDENGNLITETTQSHDN